MPTLADILNAPTPSPDAPLLTPAERSARRRMDEILGGLDELSPIVRPHQRSLVASEVWLQSPSPSQGQDAYLKFLNLERPRPKPHQQEVLLSSSPPQSSQPTRQQPLLQVVGQAWASPSVSAERSPTPHAESQAMQVTPSQEHEVPSSPKQHERQVLRCEEVLPSSRPKIEGQRSLQNANTARVMTTVQCMQIFSAAVTMMVIATTVRTEIDPDVRDRIGEAQVDILTNAVAFGVLPFFALMLLRINGYFSERMFYKYLRRGMILDFPLSDTSTVCHKPETVLFVIYFVCYGLLSLIVLIVVESKAGNFIVFFSNLGTGVFLQWLNNQSIEERSISLVKFIESFPDADGKFDNIDAVSLGRAAETMKHMTLVEAGANSYTTKARTLFYDEKELQGVALASKFRYWRQLVSVCMYGSVVLLCVLGVLYVLLQGELRTREVWDESLNPCISACVVATPLAPGEMVARRDAFRCSLCVCQCLRLFGQQLRLNECPTMLSVKASDGALFCDPVQTCPAMGTCQTVAMT